MFILCYSTEMTPPEAVTVTTTVTEAPTVKVTPSLTNPPVPGTHLQPGSGCYVPLVDIDVLDGECLIVTVKGMNGTKCLILLSGKAVYCKH